jgi:hypothetical protein
MSFALLLLLLLALSAESFVEAALLASNVSGDDTRRKRSIMHEKNSSADLKPKLWWMFVQKIGDQQSRSSRADSLISSLFLVFLWRRLTICVYFSQRAERHSSLGALAGFINFMLHCNLSKTHRRTRHFSSPLIGLFLCPLTHKEVASHYFNPSDRFSCHSINNGRSTRRLCQI